MMALEERGTFALPFGSFRIRADLNSTLKAEGETGSDADLTMLGDMVEKVAPVNGMRCMMCKDGTKNCWNRSIDSQHTVRLCNG